MKRVPPRVLGFCLVASLAAMHTARAAQQVPPALEQPNTLSQPAPDDLARPRSIDIAQQATAVADADADKPVKPLNDGPLHEAFLSPAKDAPPEYRDKAPPPPIVERPGVDRPSPQAEWISGYWNWDPSRNDFVWVTGTWRVPPPGRFWVNGYWRRDDRGWYRVPGFWSDRKTDRIDYRKDGPPSDHPDDNPGEAPGEDYFYVPGQYYPDGKGVTWKSGFWAKAQPGWSWVPAQWVRQPEGWTFQEGYWDRNLEDRGTLFAPAEVSESARLADTVYQPYTQISPESYGLLYGAFGRPNTYYDGYPGCYFDDSGRYYGYAQYGTLSPYYGYLDYPFYGTEGYPYLTSPLAYGGFGDYGYGIGYPNYYGANYWDGFGSPFFGGFGFPFFGGFGFPFFGGFGFPFFGGFGFPFFGGFGFPFFGGFGFPFFGGFNRFDGFHHKGNRNFGHNFPFHPTGRNRGFPAWVGRGNRINPLLNSRNLLRSRFMNNIRPNRGAATRMGPNVLAATHRRGIVPPPSSSPFANPFRRTTLAQNRGLRAAVNRRMGPGWSAGFNGGPRSRAALASARRTFSNSVMGPNRLGNVAGPGGAVGRRLQGGLTPRQGGFGPNRQFGALTSPLRGGMTNLPRAGVLPRASGLGPRGARVGGPMGLQRGGPAMLGTTRLSPGRPLGGNAGRLSSMSRPGGPGGLGGGFRPPAMQRMGGGFGSRGGPAAFSLGGGRGNFPGGFAPAQRGAGVVRGGGFGVGGVGRSMGGGFGGVRIVPGGFGGFGGAGMMGRGFGGGGFGGTGFGGSFGGLGGGGFGGVGIGRGGFGSGGLGGFSGGFGGMGRGGFGGGFGGGRR